VSVVLPHRGFCDWPILVCVCVCVSWGVTKCGDNPVHIQRVGRKEMKEGRKGGRKEGGKEGRREGARDGR